jgi:hypothetical protein
MAESGNVIIEDYDGNDPTGSGGNADAVNIDAGRTAQSSRDRPKVAGFELHDPGEFADGGTESGSDSQPRRRGRKPGSKNKPRGTTEEKAQSNLGEMLEDLLLSVHTMGAAFLNCEELNLDPVEAKQLAKSIKQVSRHYPAMALDPKKLALVELAACCAMIYGPRGVAIYKRVNSSEKPGPKKVVTNIQDRKQAQPNPAPQATQAQPKPNGVAGASQPSPRREYSPTELGLSQGVIDEDVY